MLRSTADARLYIGPGPVSQHCFDMEPIDLYESNSWIVVEKMESLGSLAQEWTTQELAPLAYPPAILTIKDARRGGAMQIVMGIEDLDPGQMKMIEAFNDTDAWPFRLTFSDEPGAPECRWFALVTSFGEQFDHANSVMKRVAALTLTSTVLHL